MTERIGPIRRTREQDGGYKWPEKPLGEKYQGLLDIGTTLLDESEGVELTESHREELNQLLSADAKGLWRNAEVLQRTVRKELNDLTMSIRLDMYPSVAENLLDALGQRPEITDHKDRELESYLQEELGPSIPPEFCDAAMLLACAAKDKINDVVTKDSTLDTYPDILATYGKRSRATRALINTMADEIISHKPELCSDIEQFEANMRLSEKDIAMSEIAYEYGEIFTRYGFVSSSRTFLGWRQALGPMGFRNLYELTADQGMQAVDIACGIGAVLENKMNRGEIPSQNGYERNEEVVYMLLKHARVMGALTERVLGTLYVDMTNSKGIEVFLQQINKVDEALELQEDGTFTELPYLGGSETRGGCPIPHDYEPREEQKAQYGEDIEPLQQLAQFCSENYGVDPGFLRQTEKGVLVHAGTLEMTLATLAISANILNAEGKGVNGVIEEHLMRMGAQRADKKASVRKSDYDTAN